MNTFTVVFLCIQACLVQNVFSQCPNRAVIPNAPSLINPGSLLRPTSGYSASVRKACPMGYPDTGRYAVCPVDYSNYPGYGTGIPTCPRGYGTINPATAPSGVLAPYGAVGEGNVVVRGQMPVTGRTALQGSVPIMGAVRFAGDCNSAGAVSIAGRCNCGCGAPLV